MVFNEKDFLTILCIIFMNVVIHSFPVREESFVLGHFDSFSLSSPFFCWIMGVFVQLDVIAVLNVLSIF